MNNSPTINHKAAAKGVAAARPAKAALLGTVAASLLLAANSYALPLSPGATLRPAPGETGGGGSLLDSMSSAFAADSGTFGGILSSSVIDDPSNPLGGLTFTYEISNAATSTDPILQLVLNGFGSYSVDASYQAPRTGVNPGVINRDATGDALGFRFGTKLTPGRDSALLVLQTDANWYTEASAFLIDGGTATTSIFAPATSSVSGDTGQVGVPDNGLTVTLLGFALCGLAWARRMFAV